MASYPQELAQDATYQSYTSHLTELRSLPRSAQGLNTNNNSNSNNNNNNNNKDRYYIIAVGCLFVSFPGATTHCVCIFTARQRTLASSFSRFLGNTTTRHSRQDFPGHVINPSQIPLSDNTQPSQQTSMPPVGFEPTISAGERPKTYALDRAATGTGNRCRLL